MSGTTCAGRPRSRFRLQEAVRRLAPAIAAVLFAVGETRQTAAKQPAPPTANVAPQEREVRRLIDRYFETWSAQDMQRYGDCFAPQAVVQLVDPRGKLVSLPLAPFLRSQREAHEKSKHRMVETPEQVEVRLEGRLARAVVSWKLVDGPSVQYGYDHFTLLPAEGRWKIAHLIFYGTPAPASDAKAKP